MRKFLLVLFGLLVAGTTHADNFVYLGAGISRDRLSDISDAGFAYSDIRSTSWKVFAGVRPISVVSAELDYLDLGNHTGPVTGNQGNGDARAKAFAAYGVGYLPNPIPFVDLFGKVGLARWQLDGNGSQSPPFTDLIHLVSLSQRGTEFAWGVGAGVHVSNLGARLEYESFNIPSTNGARIISLSAVLSFF